MCRTHVHYRSELALLENAYMGNRPCYISARYRIVVQNSDFRQLDLDRQEN